MHERLSFLGPVGPVLRSFPGPGRVRHPGRASWANWAGSASLARPRSGPTPGSPRLGQLGRFLGPRSGPDPQGGPVGPVGPFRLFSPPLLWLVNTSFFFLSPFCVLFSPFCLCYSPPLFCIIIFLFCVILPFFLSFSPFLCFVFLFFCVILSLFSDPCERARRNEFTLRLPIKNPQFRPGGVYQLNPPLPSSWVVLFVLFGLFWKIQK